MKTEIWTLDGGDGDMERIFRAAALLREGALVAFPTETVYGLAADPALPEACARLAEVKGRRADKPITLLVSSAREADAAVGGFCRIAQKFSRLYWPGPLTLVTERHAEQEPEWMVNLPEALAGGKRTIGQRVPDHPQTRALLAQVGRPLATSSANFSGAREPLSAADVLSDLEGRVELILDGGAVQGGMPSTVVTVLGEKIRVLRPGPIPDEELREASRPTILFVCTGNTCRSPMAEALCRFLFSPPPSAAGNPLLRRFGSPEHGAHGTATWRICSAGTNVSAGRSATMAARNVLRELGVHALEHHIARGLSPALLDGADWIFTMTRAQRRSIIDLFPETASRVRLLSQRGMEIEDPAQATEDQYRIVRDQILAALRDLPRRLKETF